MFVMAEMVLPIQGVVVQNRSTRLNCCAYQVQALDVKNKPTEDKITKSE